MKIGSELMTCRDDPPFPGKIYTGIAEVRYPDLQLRFILNFRFKALASALLPSNSKEVTSREGAAAAAESVTGFSARISPVLVEAQVNLSGGYGVGIAGHCGSLFG